MLVLFFKSLIRMLESLFNYINPIFFKNAIIFWFQSLLDCFSLYKLFKSLAKNFFALSKDNASLMAIL